MRNKGVITGSAAQQEIAANSAVLGAGKIAQLEAEMRQAKVRNDLQDSSGIRFGHNSRLCSCKRSSFSFALCFQSREVNHQREIEILTKSKNELEKHIDELVGKIAEFEGKVTQAKSLQSQEVKVRTKQFLLSSFRLVTQNLFRQKLRSRFPNGGQNKKPFSCL